MTKETEILHDILMNYTLPLTNLTESKVDQIVPSKLLAKTCEV